MPECIDCIVGYKKLGFDIVDLLGIIGHMKETGDPSLSQYFD